MTHSSPRVTKMSRSASIQSSVRCARILPIKLRCRARVGFAGPSFRCPSALSASPEGTKGPETARASIIQRYRKIWSPARS